MDIAKSAIEKHIKDSDDFDEIEIDLFGGEPFLRPDFIEELCEWTWKQNYKKPMIFFVTTNGTLIHGKLQTWLKNHKDSIWLGLSLDGTPKTHNKNRSNSYDKIDIDFFLKTYPDQPVRLTISSDSISNLSADIIYLHKLGFKVDATLAHGIKWNIEDNKIEFSRELRKLCDFYLDNPSIPSCSLFDMFLPIVSYKIDQKKWCGCGTHIVTIDVDGKEYPCQSFLPSTISDGINFDYIDFSDSNKFSDNKCSICLIKNICSTCYGINLVREDSLSTRDKNLCELNKILALANTFLIGTKIEKKMLIFENNNKLIDTINAIKMIQKEFLAIHSTN